MDFSGKHLLIVIYMFSLINFNGKVCCQPQLVVDSTQKSTAIIMKSGYFFSRKRTKSPKFSDQCGFRNFFTPGEGDFPWLALILYKELENGSYSVSCNGNLISSRHVLTAGYCVKPDGTEQSIDRMLVILGNYDVQRWLDGKDSRNYTVKTYDSHPEMVKSGSEWDVAVIALAEEVKFKTFIRPICLWSGDRDLGEGAVGILSGWRTDDGGEILTPKSTQTTLPVVLQEQCLTSHFYYGVISTNTLCAGFKYGSSSLCNYSRSSGIFGTGFMIETNRRWYLKGFYSTPTSLSCYLNMYLVFVDVSQITNWILSIVTK